MIVPPVVALFVAAALTPLLAYWARRRNLLDVPNERSSHVVATPRTGGAAFVLAVLAGIGAAWVGTGISTTLLMVVGIACVLAVVGFIDDLRSLPAALRLVIQLAVSLLLASIAVSMASPLTVSGAVSFIVIVLWMTAVTNAFNFMDGIDGIAGGQAVVAGVGWAVIGALLGSGDVVFLALVVAAAVAGFLIHNWPPAKVFMGDAGSGFLGFVFSAMPLVADERSAYVWLWSALLIWPFLFDTAFTLLRRIRRGENILRPHRSHLYQRLTATGLPHLKVSLLYAALAAVGGLATVALATSQPAAGWLSVVAVAASAFGLWRYVSARESKRVAAPA